MKRYIKLIFVLLIISLGGLFVTASSAMAAASLSLSPASKSAVVNESFTVEVKLDTKGAETDATDAIILYDAVKLTVTSATLGALYANKLEENINISGKVILRATSSATSSYSGSGTFASIVFKALETGEANVSFEFTSGSTTDSNVASSGVDILGSVANATYTITSSGVGGPTSTGSGTATGSTLPVTASIGPTIIVTGLGFLAILVSLIFTGARALLFKN